MKRTYLITGGAGFIGSNLIDKYLLESSDVEILCVDNFNDFYPKELKEKNISLHQDYENYKLYKADIRDYDSLRQIFVNHKIDNIIHLAANAGVRPSLLDTKGYVETNINGTVNLLELAKEFNVKNFTFASSSSVYGAREKGPFSEDMKIDKPISPYAATKAAGEQICYTYSHLYDIKIKCLRFFTVYGPRQRPDLAIHKFAKLISEDKEIQLFGDGTTNRDYTYIDDILQGIMSAVTYDKTPFEIFNLGESKTVELNYLIKLLQENICKKAIIKNIPLQPGDVPITYADISKARTMLNYKPTTQIEAGLTKFTQWFNDCYTKKKTSV